MKTDIIQKSIIFNDQGLMLILRRSSSDDRRPHQWDLPGGELEEGEDFLNGVHREIKEETGLEVADVRLIFAKSEVKTWEKNGQKDIANIVRLIYIAKAKPGEVVLSYEHEEFRWMLIEEAIKIYEYPTHIEILQYVIDNQLID